MHAITLRFRCAVCFVFHFATIHLLLAPLLSSSLLLAVLLITRPSICFYKCRRYLLIATRRVVVSCSLNFAFSDISSSRNEEYKSFPISFSSPPPLTGRCQQLSRVLLIHHQVAEL